MAITDLDQYKSFIQKGQAGYESTPGQLGMVDPGIRYDPRQHSYASDLYSYYLGGGRGVPSSREAGDVTPSGIMTQAPGTTVPVTGGGGGGTGIPAAGVAPMGDVGRMPTVPAGGMEGGVW